MKPIDINRISVIRQSLRPIGIPLAGEGIAMLACIVPSMLFGDGQSMSMLLSALATLISAALWFLLTKRTVVHSSEYESLNSRVSYVTVTLVWIVLAFYGSLPFLLAGFSLSDAFFESLSGLTSTGATVIPNVETLPKSLLLWRSISQWIGGFGIILLVLAIVPSLGINKYSLYTAEASGADNSGKSTSGLRSTVRRTLTVYFLLTLFFIVLLSLSGMTLWESVNLTFTNISTGGFSIYADSIAAFTPAQQYILAASMFLGGINFALLYNLLTFKWKEIRGKLDQFRFYVSLLLLSSIFTVCALHISQGLAWSDAIRLGTVQTVSVLTTTGSVVADTNLWWTPVLFLFLILTSCGGMAGSTTGGVKIMRVVILLRNVQTALSEHLHPNAYNPVRLNGKPVSKEIITNVMVIFIVYVATGIIGLLLLMMSGVNATESLGAVVGCLTSYGPGLGDCGGFGSYTAFPVFAKWICSLLMLLGRLECLTVFILFLPGFWRR